MSKKSNRSGSKANEARREERLGQERRDQPRGDGVDRGRRLMGAECWGLADDTGALT